MKPEQDKLDVIRDNVNYTLELARIEYDHEGMRVLEIGLLKGGAKDTFKHAEVKTLDIVDGGDYKIDICDISAVVCEDWDFDCVICTEVLEHTEAPTTAAKTIEYILKPKGKAYITTPYNFRIHNPLPDYWRFTEHALRMMFKGLKVEQLKGIGGTELNPICYRMIIEKE